MPGGAGLDLGGERGHLVVAERDVDQHPLGGRARQRVVALRWAA